MAIPTNKGEGEGRGDFKCLKGSFLLTRGERGSDALIVKGGIESVTTTHPIRGQRSGDSPCQRGRRLVTLLSNHPRERGLVRVVTHFVKEIVQRVAW